jgi:hypothetical protein
LQKQTEECEGMKMKAEKAEVMNFSSEPSPPDVTIYQKNWIIWYISAA